MIIIYTLLYILSCVATFIVISIINKNVPDKNVRAPVATIVSLSIVSLAGLATYIVLLFLLTRCDNNTMYSYLKKFTGNDY